MRTAIRLILISVLMITPTILSIPMQADPAITEPTPLKNMIRGLQIEFDPPQVIQDCGSLFTLKVNVTRYRSTPLIFSLSAFLKLKDQYQKEIVHKIGFAPYVFIPPLHRKTVTVEIPCFTTRDLEHQLTMLTTENKKQIQFKHAEIGVKVDRICHWGINSIFWNACINKGFKIKNYLLSNGEDIYLQFFVQNKGLTGIPLRTIRLFQLYQRVNSVFKRNNPFIVWKKVEVCPPLACSTDVTIKNVHVNKILEHKNFTLQVNILNDFQKDYPLKMLVLVDLDSKPIVNSLIPTLKNTHYSIGFNKTRLKKGLNTINVTCQLPEDKQLYFGNDTFTLSVECIPYLPLDNISQFGILFFNIRWLLVIKPFYVVSAEVQDAIQEMWYNLPLFYGETDSASIFPIDHKEIEYVGEQPTDDIKEIIQSLSDEVKNWIFIYFILLSIIIVFALVGYRIIIKK